MALGDYTPTAWVNDTTPAITATTLGHIETKIDEIDSAVVAGAGGLVNADLVDSIHGSAMWYSSSGTGGSDGNAGQPPAPKAGGTGPGKIQHVAVDLDSFDCYANGTGSAGGASEVWFYHMYRVTDAGVTDAWFTAVAAGNTVVMSGTAAKTARGFAWRMT